MNRISVRHSKDLLMVGKTVLEIENVEFGDIADIVNVDFSNYRTCRGTANIDQIKRIFDLAMDNYADEDERDDAINDGLWDLLIHQYTLFSVTPLALYLLLKTTTAEERAKFRDIHEFVEICKRRSNEGIFLTLEEIEKNKQGILPIYSIVDILDAHA